VSGGFLDDSAAQAKPTAAGFVINPFQSLCIGAKPQTASPVHELPIARLI
jgi:hypothetical protein